MNATNQQICQCSFAEFGGIDWRTNKFHGLLVNSKTAEFSKLTYNNGTWTYFMKS